MAAYKSILVPVSDAKTGAGPLDAAFRMAGRFGSHVVALHVRTDPTAAVPLVGEGMSGAMVEEMMNIAEAQAAKRAAAARVVFDEIVARHGVPVKDVPPAEGLSTEWLDVTGREEEVVARRGRLADLVVIGRPDAEDEIPSLMTLNAALMESGRPLLLIPPGEPVEGFGRRVVIAWNGSAEAGRAVAAAMPLLAAAETVAILSVAENERTGAAPAAELATYLAWHGITATPRLIHAPGKHAGEELLREAANAGADLLVMGAYTHSRLRQMILGGVTRHVLHQAAIPCLMSH
ncbi:MAG: universal stress protein [Actinomycetota bacterium]